MIAAVVIAMIVMFAAAGPVGQFIEAHPTTKMLALAFLLLIGAALLADGFHFHIPRGYIYTAMGFAGRGRTVQRACPPQPAEEIPPLVKQEIVMPRPVLLVAGGSRGIGAATARLAGERGYDVAVNYNSNANAAASWSLP